MITNNYRNLMRAVFQGTGNVSVKDYAGATKYIKPGSDECFISYNCFASQLTNAMASTDNCGVFFGTGTTPASASDYMLEGKITTGLGVVNPKSCLRVVGADGKITYVATYMLKNNTTADITIGEIGLFVKTYGGTSTQNNYNGTEMYILADRTVLDEPLTIPAGEVRALTYNIVFDMSFV